MTDSIGPQPVQASLDDLCNDALKHYEEVSVMALHWNSLIPHAIDFYRCYKDRVEWLESRLTKLQSKRKEELREAFEAGFQFSESMPDYENGETKDAAFTAFLASHKHSTEQEGK